MCVGEECLSQVEEEEAIFILQSDLSVQHGGVIIPGGNISYFSCTFIKKIKKPFYL